MTRELPESVIARWRAEDWDDNTMMARAYTYEDAETREPVELTVPEASRYSWGYCADDLTGGSQRGDLFE